MHAGAGAKPRLQLLWDAHSPVPLPARVAPPPAVHPPLVPPPEAPWHALRHSASAAGLLPLELHADGSDVELDSLLDDDELDMYES